MILGGEASIGESIVVLRLKLYRDEIKPAYEALLRRGETRPIVKLLERASRRASAEPAKTTAEVKNKINELFLEARTAEARGDPLPSQEYAGRVAELLEWRAPRRLSRLEIGKYVAMLKSEHASDVEEAHDWLRVAAVNGLIELLCIPLGDLASPVREMGNYDLNKYLESSEWIVRHALHGRPKGPEIELPDGSYIGVFTREEVGQFKLELSSLGRPAAPGVAQREFDALVIQVNAVLQNPELELVLMDP